VAVALLRWEFMEMNICSSHWPAWLLAASTLLLPARASVVYEATSPYHHIRVVDQQGIRTLSFDQSQ